MCTSCYSRKLFSSRLLPSLRGIVLLLVRLTVTLRHGVFLLNRTSKLVFWSYLDFIAHLFLFVNNTFVNSNIFVCSCKPGYVNRHFVWFITSLKRELVVPELFNLEAVVLMLRSSIVITSTYINKAKFIKFKCYIIYAGRWISPGCNVRNRAKSYLLQVNENYIKTYTEGRSMRVNDNLQW